MQLEGLTNTIALLDDAVRSVASIAIDGDRISGIRESGEPVEHWERCIFPGFIDIHNHGAAGVDVNSADCDGLIRIASFLASRGVTAWMPTLVPDSDENYERTVAAIEELIAAQDELPIARAVGVHYEGVYANELMCGALRPEYFKPASEIGLPRLKFGVHMTTLAPEIDGAVELIEKLTADGWIVAIGHTRADTQQLERAYAAGARHLTHFFNAMTGIHHRALGVAGWGLTREGVTFDIIADGIHVQPEIVRLAARARGIEAVSLISDSIAPTGLGDGSYALWGQTVTVKDGRTGNAAGSIAGSVITMHDAVAEMLRLGFGPGDVARMASTNPASVLRLSGHGSLAIGARADFAVMGRDGRLIDVVVGGKQISA